MAEAAEIPEAKDPYERRVAITIAIIAVVMALNASRNDNAKTDAILKSIEASQKTTEAANKWSYFQSKSIKEHTYDLQRSVLPALTAGDAAVRDRLVADFTKKVDTYEHEKAGIKAEAEALEAESKQLRRIATQNVAVNERCDRAELPLQIAVILCSVAILVGIASFWYIGIVAAIIGAVIGATSYLMPVDEPLPEAAPVAASTPAAGAPATPPAR